MDFKLWDLKDRFTIVEAACLWFEENPYYYGRGIHQHASDIEILINDITGYFFHGCKPRKNGLWDSIHRDELRTFALSRGERPLFLFPEDRAKESEPQPTWFSRIKNTISTPQTELGIKYNQDTSRIRNPSLDTGKEVAKAIGTSERLTPRNAAFLVCNKQPTDCIVDDDVAQVLYWLLCAIGDFALRVWYKDFCNYTRATERIPTAEHEIANEIYVTLADLKVYLDRLLNWFSGKGFSSPLDKALKFSNRRGALSPECFRQWLSRHNRFLDNDLKDNPSFSRQAWIPVIEDAISRLSKQQPESEAKEVSTEQPEVEAEDKQEISQEKKSVFSHSPDYRSVNLQGQPYSLTSKLAQVVEILHVNYEQKTPEVSESWLLNRIDSTQSRLRDVFKGPMEKVFKAIVVRGQRKDTYRLNI